MVDSVSPNPTCQRRQEGDELHWVDLTTSGVPGHRVGISVLPVARRSYWCPWSGRESSRASSPPRMAEQLCCMPVAEPLRPWLSLVRGEGDSGGRGKVVACKKLEKGWTRGRWQRGQELRRAHATLARESSRWGTHLRGWACVGNARGEEEASTVLGSPWGWGGQHCAWICVSAWASCGGDNGARPWRNCCRAVLGEGGRKWAGKWGSGVASQPGEAGQKT